MASRGAAGPDETSLARRALDLEAAIAGLESRLPAHSVPAALLLRLEELEEELTRVRATLPGGTS